LARVVFAFPRTDFPSWFVSFFGSGFFSFPFLLHPVYPFYVLDFFSNLDTASILRSAAPPGALRVLFFSRLCSPPQLIPPKFFPFLADTCPSLLILWVSSPPGAFAICWSSSTTIEKFATKALSLFIASSFELGFPLESAFHLLYHLNHPPSFLAK